jgi:flagellum-specific ATP synthase
MNEVISSEHLNEARRLTQVLATYREAEDLINIGAYVDGSDPDIDFAKKTIDKINGFLQQDTSERVTFEESTARLGDLLAPRREASK